VSLSQVRLLAQPLGIAPPADAIDDVVMAKVSPLLLADRVCPRLLRPRWRR